MVRIHCYDVTDLDREQLAAALTGDDVAFEASGLTTQTVDPEAEVISVFVHTKVTAELMVAMPKLKLIACRSTGFNNVDLKAADQRGVTVVNVPTYGENTVAEYAFALLLALMRRLPQAMQAFEQGDRSQTGLMGSDVRGKTLGIIGTGHIGCMVAQIANGFGMKMLAYDAYPVPERAGQYGFTYVELEELLRQSDVVSLHVPLLPTTQHLLNSERLALMKPSAVLVNTARGEVVDTAALAEALEAGRLAGAALDVFEGEDLVGTPALNQSPLGKLKQRPNVIITNHNAFNTREAIQRINDTTVANIRQFLAGSPQNVVKAEE